MVSTLFEIEDKSSNNNARKISNNVEELGFYLLKTSKFEKPSNK
jgi:hypothetical protein